MAQKHLPILNRVGLFQHWANAWDGKKTYSLRHRQQFLFESLLRDFVEHRNSISIYLFNQADLDEQLKVVDKLPEEPTFLTLVEAVREHRRKRHRYIYVGQIVMLRFQTWTIFLLFIYKPVVKKKKVAKFNRELPPMPKFFVDTQVSAVPLYKAIF